MNGQKRSDGGECGINGYHHECPDALGSGAASCSHDYDNPKRLGRLHYHCPKCDADISLDCVMIAEAMMGENQSGQQP